MFSNIYLKILTLIISAIDLGNKKKIISFFKKKLKNKQIIIIDIGAHKGETIRLFYNNFHIKKIFAFEANTEIFKSLKKKLNHIDFRNKLFLYNVGLGDKRSRRYFNIIKDSSSSTFNSINSNSAYYKRKVQYLFFFNKKNDLIEKKILMKIKPLHEFREIFDNRNIDILKIDTEGYELNILKGIKNSDLKKIKLIYLEHHYDLMVRKDYKFSDLNNFLDKNNFSLKFKIRMKFRKTFEYIYENQKKES